MVWNGIEIIGDNNGILWLNEKHVEERLNLKNSPEITTKYHSDHKKHRCELAEEPKKQCNRIFKDERLTVNVIMDYKTTSSHKFRSRLGFKHYDVILTKQQSVLKIMKHNIMF